jgi:hypothetical protein
MVGEIASCYAGCMTPLPARTKRLVILGPALLVLGIAAALCTRDAWAGYLTTTGAAVSLLGLHRLGRGGPDRSAAPTERLS